jgi:hypothetical protein
MDGLYKRCIPVKKLGFLLDVRREEDRIGRFWKNILLLLFIFEPLLCFVALDDYLAQSEQ